MFSVWPELFAFKMVAATLLRIVAGYIFLQLSARMLRTAKRNTPATPSVRTYQIGSGVVMGAVGVCLLLGWYTQPAALAGVLLALLTLTTQRGRQSEQNVLLLLATVSLSLLALGPGLFALDLPL